MTVSTTDNRLQFSGDGNTTAFAVSFAFDQEEDLLVILTDSSGVETEQTLTTHYTVSGGDTGSGVATGTVTMVTAPATGETLTIINDPGLTQSVDLEPADPLPAADVEKALDRAVLLAQRDRNLIERTLRLSDGFVGTFAVELPASVVAGAFLGANTAGTGLEWKSGVSDNQVSIPTGTGIVVKDGSTSTVLRALAGGDGIDITNGNGVSGNPTIAVGSTLSDKTLVRPYITGHRVAQVSVNTNTTVTNVQTFIRADTSGGAITITLPALASLSDGHRLGIQYSDSNFANAVTIAVDTPASETIGSGSDTSTTLNTERETVWLILDKPNSKWVIERRDIPSEWISVTCTPPYTNTSATSFMKRVGDSAKFLVDISFASGGYSGSPDIGLPITIDTAKLPRTETGGATLIPHSTGVAQDNSAGNEALLVVAYQSTTDVRLYYLLATGTPVELGSINTLNPYTWAVSDHWNVSFEVPVSGWKV